MKKALLFTVLFLGVALFLSRCVISQMRWSDKKALRVFKSKNVPLEFFDTVIRGRTIHFASTGSDTLPTLIIIHGSPGSWFHYMKLMRDAELRKKFRIVSFDRPGFGQSDYGKPLGLQEQCALLLPVVRKLANGKPLFLCGHSYGGPVVAKLGADAPELFHSIVIAAGSLDPDLEKKETWRHIMENEPLSLFLPGAHRPSNTELLYLKEDLKPLAADLKNITSHVHFIHGDEDTWVPIENVRYGVKMMPNAASIRVDTIRGAGHQIPWKYRDEFKNLLLELY
jgi:pimeloyl-ACP methyl ester carboxylesterase